ncbi:MAG: hypothetical protein AAF495_06480 [Pseudomonadota bacterium]
MMKSHLGAGLGALMLGALIALAPGGQAAAEPLETGGFSFSDEQGGFRLVSVSGSGTTDDPIVLVEEIFDLNPIVLVIRRLPDSEDSAAPAMGFSAMTLSMTKVVFNRTKKVWGGFDLELQETLNQPSIYGDGLSFDQPGVFGQTVRSDFFAFNRLQQEPYDRILFRDGEIDPETSVQFTFYVTDPTPPKIFYLLQEPQFLTAGVPHPTVQLAERNPATAPRPSPP